MCGFVDLVGFAADVDGCGEGALEGSFCWIRTLKIPCNRKFYRDYDLLLLGACALVCGDL